jgi:predicted nucleic acid-binding protein
MVIDTMVFVYALLGVEEFRQDAAEILERAETITVPDSLRVELANVLWQWISHRNVPLDTAFEVMEDAESLITRTLAGDSLWERALVLALNSKHPAYDTYFVAAAEIEDTHVVTFDRKLKAAFPDRVLTANEYLSSAS